MPSVNYADCKILFVRKVSYNVKKPDLVLKLVEKYGIEFRNPFNQTPLIAAAWIGNVEIIKRLRELV